MAKGKSLFAYHKKKKHTRQNTYILVVEVLAIST